MSCIDSSCTWEESERVRKFEENERAVMHRNEIKGYIEIIREDTRDAMLRSILKWMEVRRENKIHIMPRNKINHVGVRRKIREMSFSEMKYNKT